MLLFLICLVIVILFLRAIIIDLNRTRPSDDLITFKDFNFPSLEPPNGRVIINMINTMRVSHAIFWWNNIDEATKNKLEKEVLDAFTCKFKEPLTSSDMKFLKRVGL